MIWREKGRKDFGDGGKEKEGKEKKAKDIYSEG